MKIVLLVNLQMQHHVGREPPGMYPDTGTPILTVGRTTPYAGTLGGINGWASTEYFITAKDTDAKATANNDLCVVTLTCGSDKKGSINVWFFPTSPVFTEVTWFPSFQALWTYMLQRPGYLPMCWVSPVSAPAQTTCVHPESSRTFHVSEEFGSFRQGDAYTQWLEC